ncbi:MAG: hypothetical protein KY468_04745 [Armatimonadetes bacterium]|nr:hypothetical protein [Armatimonadota bacterium]
MSIYNGFAEEVTGLQEEIRLGLGTDILLIETGQTVRCWIRQLAENDFPLIEPGPEGNSNELDPRVLDLLPPDIDTEALEHVVIPATGDKNKDRYPISALQPIYFQNTLVKYKALVYVSPNRKGSTP